MNYTGPMSSIRAVLFSLVGKTVECRYGDSAYVIRTGSDLSVPRVLVEVGEDVILLREERNPSAQTWLAIAHIGLIDIAEP